MCAAEVKALSFFCGFPIAVARTLSFLFLAVSSDIFMKTTFLKYEQIFTRKKSGY